MDDFCLKLTRLEELKQKTSRAAPLRRLLQQTVMQRGGVFQVSAEGLCIYYQPAEVKEFAPLNEVSAMESLANMQDLRNKTCDEVMEIVTAHAARGGGGSVLGLCEGCWSESISISSSWLVGFSCSLLSLVLRDMMMNKKNLSWLIS